MKIKTDKEKKQIIVIKEGYIELEKPFERDFEAIIRQKGLNRHELQAVSNQLERTFGKEAKLIDIIDILN